MDINKFRKILERYIKGHSNETETALIEAWYKSYSTKERELDDNEAQTIKASIHSSVKKSITPARIIKLNFFRIAACILLASGVSFWVWKSSKRNSRQADNYYIITTNTKGLKEVTLPDSSVIWLNAASSLKVPVAFTGHLREVSLIEGEAFFDIKRNVVHPFIVHTKALNVQVLGTSFNIRAYHDLKKIDVSVITGKVGITQNANTLAMLLPLQQLTYNVADHKYAQKSISRDAALSWKDGYTTLNQAGFNELAVIVKNIYGLHIKAGNAKVAQYRFSLRLTHNLPADKILTLISKIHNTHFRKEGDDIVFY
ncbi:FecR family protein [Mucilaginibacter segetis]|uniref:FecR family protein n=1 Tax=Mucilaginibacter segetis TaxID=2793071 RepID=A0A934PS77_9SPHI|nr:FecR family protein [Mucilaginibacter segetis]MBK0378465.1 FecR family protein [Mucilaginibacter segetis]